MGKHDSLLTEEHHLVRKISGSNEYAFKQLFFDYYSPLCKFAFRFTRSSDLARDCVQEVFFRIWKNREVWEIDHSLNAYLYRAVRNQALNLMKQEEVQSRLAEIFHKEMFIRDNAEHDQIPSDPLQHLSNRIQRIWELIETMPKQQRQVFELHRKNGLSYKEISEVMNISPKTIEGHMSKVLKHLRENLDADRFIDLD